MVRTRQPTIDGAIVRTDEEIDLVRIERDAFEAFLNHLRSIQSHGWDISEIERNHTALTTEQSSAATGLQEIRQAYRDTVMGASHYDREYDDTLRESLKMEFGETLSNHVVDGQTLTPPVREYLVSATKQVRNQRDEFLDQLHRERESLSTVADELNEIEARAVEFDRRIETTDTSTHLSEIDATLETLEERCTSLVARRQGRIQNRSNQNISGFDSDSLLQYLYHDMETVTPALADAVSCLDIIRHKRTRCLR